MMGSLITLLPSFPSLQGPTITSHGYTAEDDSSALTLVGEATFKPWPCLELNLLKFSTSYSCHTSCTHLLKLFNHSNRHVQFTFSLCSIVFYV